ncbi:MAG: BTAD domain-containing putative transcriptional regulator [Coriobacteriia bacterium]|nr:BTAD domain-containing putative transcriptional regulator [Coriobacteriia bacterium]
MSNFVERSACRGAHPKSVDLKNKYVRDELISRLMEDRAVLRIVRAPNGFGKTTLIGQYADVVFSFEDVYWLNCQSPCFIRDLDSGYLNENIEEASLVVLDEMPHLDSERTNKLSKFIDLLLKQNIEVILTVTPINDTISEHQKTSLILNSRDMLISDSEFKIFRHKKTIKGDVGRIISVVKYGLKEILSSSMTEDFNEDVYAAIFYIYIFMEGDLSSLRKYKFVQYFAQDYLYLGVNENNDSFSVPYVSVNNICKIYNNKIDRIAKSFGFENKDSFGQYLAKKFVHRGNYSRATEALQHLCLVKTKYMYLKKFNLLSFKKGIIIEMNNLYNSVMSSRIKIDSNCVTYQAWRKYLLGDSTEAIKYAYKVIDNTESSIINKMMSAFIFMSCGASPEKHQAQRLISQLRSMLQDSNNIGRRTKRLFTYKLCLSLSDIYFAIYQNSENVFDLFNQMEPGDIQIISAICILKHLKYVPANQFEQIKVASFFQNTYSIINDMSHNFYFYLLVQAYIEASKIIEQYVAELNKDIIVEVNQYFEEFNKQKFKYLNVSNLVKVKTKEITKDSNLPKLVVKLLGGLEVNIAGKQLLNKDFGRQNVKLLLALLVLSNGNEVSKDYLASNIWPECDIHRARRNLNSCWCVLNKIIGQPYIMKNQKCYRINETLLDSDVLSLDNFCSDMTMGTIDPDGWYESIKENKNYFEYDLLPSEDENSIIIKKRQYYKNKVIDALLSASQRLLEVNEERQALWFAYRAIDRDDKREDVYLNLMDIQLACGQRSPAIETFTACKKFLDKEYGISPSFKMQKMYKKAVHEFS